MDESSVSCTAAMEVETHEKEPTRKYRQNTQKSIRDVRMKKKAKGEKSKSTDTRYLKKAFMKSVEKSNYQVSRIHQFIGNPADFFICVKDSIHSKTSKPAAATAGKYICYGEGEIMDTFLNEGISYKKEDFYICEDFTVKPEILPTTPTKDEPRSWIPASIRKPQQSSSASATPASTPVQPPTIPETFCFPVSPGFSPPSSIFGRAISDIKLQPCPEKSFWFSG